MLGRTSPNGPQRAGIDKKIDHGVAQRLDKPVNSDSINHNVGITIINPPFGNGLYQLSMVIWGIPNGSSLVRRWLATVSPLLSCHAQNHYFILIHLNQWCKRYMMNDRWLMISVLQFVWIHVSFPLCCQAQREQRLSGAGLLRNTSGGRRREWLGSLLWIFWTTTSRKKNGILLGFFGIRQIFGQNVCFPSINRF